MIIAYEMRYSWDRLRYFCTGSNLYGYWRSRRTTEATVDTRGFPGRLVKTLVSRLPLILTRIFE